MDKYRKAIVELCAAVELAGEDAIDELGGKVITLDPRDWRAIIKQVNEIKAGFNHSTQYRYEQHLEREKALRGQRKGAA